MASEYFRTISSNQLSNLYRALMGSNSPFTRAMLEAFRQTGSRDISATCDNLSFSENPTGFTLVSLASPRDRYAELRMNIIRGNGENESSPKWDPEWLKAQTEVMKLTGNGSYPIISVHSEDLTIPAGRFGNITLVKMASNIFEASPENLTARRLFENVLCQFQAIDRHRINMYLAQDS